MKQILKSLDDIMFGIMAGFALALFLRFPATTHSRENRPRVEDVPPPPPRSIGQIEHARPRKSLFAVLLEVLGLIFLTLLLGGLVIWIVDGAEDDSQKFARKGNEVKPGQVWVYRSKYPFHTLATTNTVLAVKDGYVQFRDQNGEIRSYSMRMFTEGSKKISEWPDGKGVTTPVPSWTGTFRILPAPPPQAYPMTEFKHGTKSI